MDLKNGESGQDYNLSLNIIFSVFDSHHQILKWT